MRLSRRRAIGLMGPALLAGCPGRSDESSDPTTTDPTTGTDPTPTTSPGEEPAVYELGDSVTRTFDLTRGRDLMATEVVYLALDSAGTLRYEVDVETSADVETPIDVEILPDSPGNLESYLQMNGYTYVPEASATGVMSASVTESLNAGRYACVLDNSRRGSSGAGPQVPADSVEATFSLELSR